MEDRLPQAVEGELKKQQIFREKAVFIRKVSNSCYLETILLEALKVLKRFHIPHFASGGFAVQESGYPRFAQDFDLIVPDVSIAREKLAKYGLMNSKVWVNLIAGGSGVGSSPVRFPMPTTVSDQPQLLPLHDLLSVKLASYQESRIRHAQEYGDVVQLMKANHPPRDLPVHSAVKTLFEETWDGLLAKSLSASIT